MQRLTMNSFYSVEYGVFLLYPGGDSLQDFIKQLDGNSNKNLERGLVILPQLIYELVIMHIS